MSGKRPKGFSLPELMIVMTVMGILSGVLLAMYGESELMLVRGMTLTTLEQTARLGGARIIPKITSSVAKPATPDHPVLANRPAVPAIVSPPAPPYTVAPDRRQLVLNSIDTYVQRQMRLPETVFNPRNPTYLKYRIFFALDTTKNQADPNLAPGGRIGNVWMDLNTPGTPSDDLLLARNFYDVTFDREPDNVVLLTITAKGWIKRAVGGRTLADRVYTTRVHLPIYTYTPGGT